MEVVYPDSFIEKRNSKEGNVAVGLKIYFEVNVQRYFEADRRKSLYLLQGHFTFRLEKCDTRFNININKGETRK